MDLGKVHRKRNLLYLILLCCLLFFAESVRLDLNINKYLFRGYLFDLHLKAQTKISKRRASIHVQVIYSITEKCRQHSSNITNSFIPSLRQKILLKGKYCRSSNTHHTTRAFHTLSEHHCFTRERNIKRQRKQTALLCVGITAKEAGVTGCCVYYSGCSGYQNQTISVVFNKLKVTSLGSRCSWRTIIRRLTSIDSLKIVNAKF